MNSISTHIHYPFRSSSLSIFPSSFTFNFPSQFPSHPFLNPISPNCILNSARLRTPNPHVHRNYRSSQVLKASTSSGYAPEIGEILGDVRIFTAGGEPVLFKDLWDQTEGMAVVALLRHFGCFCCWELASTLKEAKERFDSSGVKLIAVGIGTPNKARILAERLPFPMDCLYADPDRKAYDLLGLYYGFGRTFLNPASVKVFSKTRFDVMREAMKNYTLEATPDDKSSVLQQGGMFVFKGKQLLYARKDEGTGDHAPLDDIYNICCQVPAT
ncbi:uncharacterized protein LOC103497363 isoform X1 [Cucumis melo]|uniref:Uncharacterized protein LOC103497363 isoform X1 n=1 Tax=Cucumis melo TaxID=3656 RepID=A0A1S3C7I5_CUCME|nr:uncharacterized protein LOC103497363 isoform X1 [Cucumis melo]